MAEILNTLMINPNPKVITDTRVRTKYHHQTFKHGNATLDAVRTKITFQSEVPFMSFNTLKYG